MVDGVKIFGGLADEAFLEGFVGLFAVPGASVWRAQTAHDVHEAFKFGHVHIVQYSVAGVS